MLCFDGDEAGQRAARRAAERALPLLAPGKSLRFARLPDDRDPDDLVRQEGAAALRAVVERAQAPVDLLWSSEAEAVRPDSPDRRARFSRSLLALASGIRDDTVRRYYEAEILSRLRERFGVNLRPAAGPRQPATPSLAGGGRERGEARIAGLRRRLVERALSAALNRPALAVEFAQEIAELDCEGDAQLDRLCQEILGLAAGGEGVDPAVWRANLEAAGLSGAVRGVLCEAVYGLAPFARPAASAEEAREGMEQVFAACRSAAVERDVAAAAEHVGEEALERMPALVMEARRLRARDGM